MSFTAHTTNTTPTDADIFSTVTIAASVFYQYCAQLGVCIRFLDFSFFCSQQKPNSPKTNAAKTVTYPLKPPHLADHFKPCKSKI